MSRPLLDTFLVTLQSPAAVGYAFLALELTVVVCGVLALVHALGERRRGDGVPLFVWAASFTYGIVMELGSYNFIDSFKHGQFTVMFYRKQLPLYVVTLYPVLQYTSIVAARRLRLGLVPEAFAAGLLIVAMDMPFDILGPVHGWWSWSASDPNMAFRWHDVPVTSYYWHLAWGGILAGLCRAFGRYGGNVAHPGRVATMALPVALMTIGLGLVAFGPYHLLKARGVPDGTIVIGLFVVALTALAIGLGRRAADSGPAGERDRLLLAIPLLFYACHLGLAVHGLASAGSSFAGRFAVIICVSALALVAYGLSAAPAPGPARRR